MDFAGPNRYITSMEKRPLTILLSAPRGFCAGVDRAIQIVEKAIEKYGAPVYVRHEIVHNKFVVDSLRAQGAVFVEELSEIPDDGRPVIFSAHGVPRKPEALATHRCIAFEGLTPGGAWIFRNGSALTSVPVRARLSVNTAEAAIDAALSGLGLTRVLSYQVAAALKAGSLRAVLTRYEPEQWPVSLVYPGQGRLPLKLRAFLDFAAPRLKRRLTQM